MKTKARDWSVCIIFWACMAMLALKYTEGATCLGHEVPVTKRLFERVVGSK